MAYISRMSWGACSLLLRRCSFDIFDRSFIRNEVKMAQEFYLPTRVVTGRGSLEQLGKLSAPFGDRILLVCGTHSVQQGEIVPRVTELLNAARLRVELFTRVSGEADIDMVTAGLDCLRRSNCGVVVGLGGGSAMDTAKSIAGLATQEGGIYEYHVGRVPEKPGLPFIAVPTTAGTGAEVTRNAVLINPHTRFKTSIRGDDWFARVALVDPELCLTMSPELTANTGSDALCQAIEAYTSIAATPITDALAEKAIALIGRNLQQAYMNGSDINVREGMSMGSLLAGMAMSNARLGAVHGMAHPLGAHFNISHGLICGLLLPYVMDYNLDFAVTKYARIASLIGNHMPTESAIQAASSAVDLVRRLLVQIGISGHLSAFGVRREDLPLVIEEAFPSGSTKHNARPIGKNDLERILISAL
jgi:alcohol dehydrogenase class IV